MLCNIAVGMNLGELLYSIKRKGIPHLFVFNKSYSIFVSDVNKASVADYRWPALNIDVHGCIIQNNLFETPFFIIYFSGDPYQLQPVFTTTQREQLYSRLVLPFLCILCITSIVSVENVIE